MSWKKFWNFQEGVGKAGAEVNYIGAIISAIILGLIAIGLIVAGILVLTGEVNLTDDTTKKDTTPEENKYIGWGMIVFGIFLIIMAVLGVWASGYWNKAVKKNSGLAKAGGFLFEAQILNDIFGK
jgi:hypothetical protein